MFTAISKRKKNNRLPMSKGVTKALAPYREIIKKGNDWIEDEYDNGHIKDIYIESFDKLNLHAIFIEHKNSRGIFLECHGYRSTASRDLYASCYEYYDMGYSLLITDNRACNLSEGKYITFGIHESMDIHSWIEYLNREFPGKDIILAGISMGASSILMSLRNTAENTSIRCAIADSGYISPYEEVLYCIKHYFRLNGRAFIDMIDVWCKLFAGFSLKENDTVSSLKEVKIPILFIHGLADEFVPPVNSEENYRRYDGIKQLELFENADHGMSYLIDPERYIESVRSILSEQ